MDAYNRDIQSLLLESIRFVVPPFQRHYVWTSDEWTRLWQDLVDTVERTDRMDHFLGSIVLQQMPSRAGEPVVRDVVDGQQRLTTLQLLLAAVRDAAAGGGQSALAARVGDLTTNPMRGVVEHIFKVWPCAADQEAFRHAMTAGGAAALSALYEGRRKPPIVEAYLHFARLVAAGPELGRLIDVITSRVHLVVLDLSDRDDPQAVYEQLNSRGIALRPSELARNHIFYQCERQGLPKEKIYEEYWADFDDGYWYDQESYRAGTRLDVFLRSFLIMERREDVRLDRLFVTFREYVADHLRDLPSLLARFARYGEVFARIDTGEDLAAYERAFVIRLRDLDYTVVTPVLLRLFGDYDAARRQPALHAIDSYLVRRELCGLGTREHGDLMIRLLRQLDGSEPGAVTTAVLAAQVNANRWPTDVDLRTAVTSRPLYSPNRPKRRLRAILMLAEDQLRTANSEALDYAPENLTIEHLLPQAWKGVSWPVDDADPARAAQERRRRDELVQTLGNLTLLTKTLNERLANGPWIDKLRALRAFSSLRLNQNLPDAFDADEIRRRGEWLADLLCEALPAPPSPAVARRPAREPLAVLLPEPVAGPETEDAGGGEDDLDDEDAIPTTPTTQRRRSFAAHIREALAAEPGSILTVAELAAATSTSFPEGGVRAAALRDLLKRGAVSGVRTTTKDGRLAASLNPRKAGGRRATKVDG